MACSAARQPTRRAMLAGGVAALAGCGRRGYPEDGRVHLEFMAWGDGLEWQAIEQAVARFHQHQDRVRVYPQRVSYQFADQLDTRLAAGVGPDIFRISYNDIGRYTPSGSLIDLSPYLPAGMAEQFSASAWFAVLYQGRPRALPFHTDTSALVYNRDMFNRLGVKMPRSIQEAWTWEQFTDVARALQRHRIADYGFGMNWTFAGAFRWLNFLYQRGGRLLQDDLHTPAIPSQEAYDTLAWTQRWFKDRLVPSNTAPKTGEMIDQLWVTQVIGMQFDVGVNGVRFRPPAFPWGVTYLPRDRVMASELGGTALGISRDCQHPAEAAEFLLFLTNEENMREFCLAVQYLPARTALLQRGLDYPFRPDVMRIFLEQATTVPEHLVRTLALPGFSRINTKLATELSACLAGSQPVETTLRRLAQETQRALA